ncbi:MAG: thioredoxin family protein [Pseudomonadota bacterium]
MARSNKLFMSMGAGLIAVVAMAGIAILNSNDVSAANSAVSVGAPAPDFSGMDSNGKTHKLSDYQGKTVVLEWTNHDCPYVVKHYSSGNMQSTQKDLTEKDVVWLTVISSSPGTQGHVSAEKANELTTSRGAVPSAVILDESGDIGRLYGAKTTPHMYIVDEAGQLVYMGGMDDKPSPSKSSLEGATNYVRVAMTEMAEGKPITSAVTRPYGCSVKYK